MRLRHEVVWEYRGVCPTLPECTLLVVMYDYFEEVARELCPNFT